MYVNALFMQPEQYKLGEIPIAKIGSTVLVFFQHLQRTMVETAQRPCVSLRFLWACFLSTTAIPFEQQHYCLPA